MAEQELFFFRSWALTIEDPNSPGTGHRYDSLRVVFKIEKTSEFASNKAKIEVYNLSQSSRRSFQKKGLQIRLDAGYVGLMDILYIGDVTRSTSKRSGPEIITSFECGDSEKEIEQTHFEKSYGAGTPYVQVVKDIAMAMGVSIGALTTFPTLNFNTGVTFSRTCRDALEELLKGQGLEASVQNGVLQIIPIGSHTGDEAIVLNSETGLIGVPSNKDDGVEFDALLNTRIVPGRPVLIQSGTINGIHKVRKAVFEGDSHGEKWFVKCEAVEIPGVQFTPTTAGKFRTG